MITQEQQIKGQKTLNTLIERAWEDKEFKSKLIANPKETIAIAMGKDPSSFSPDKEILVEDQTNDSIIYLNIPRRISQDDFELSDEQLELGSGGELLGSAAVVGGVIVAGLIGAAVGYAICSWLE